MPAKHKAPRRNLKRTVVNVFGSFGYLLCALQWFWAAMLYFSVIQSMTLLVTPKVEESAPRVPQFTFAAPQPLEILILSIITLTMIAVTIYVLIKMPSSIAKTGSKAVHKTTEAVMPVVMKAQHQKDTKKTRMRLTVRLVLVIKLLAVIVPLALAAGSRLLETQELDYGIVLVVGCTLAVLSLSAFAVQYTLARLLHVPYGHIR